MLKIKYTLLCHRRVLDTTPWLAWLAGDRTGINVVVVVQGTSPWPKGPFVARWGLPLWAV